MSSNLPAASVERSIKAHRQAELPNVMRPRIGDYALAILVALGGLTFLGAMQIAPSKSDRIAILIYPPWVSAQTVGTEVAALNLPLRDIRWNGRMIAIDLSDPTALTRNQLHGWYSGAAIRISGSISSGCASIGY